MAEESRDLSLEIRVDGIETIGQLRKHITALKKENDALKFGTEDQIKKEKELAHARNEMTRVTQGSKSAVAQSRDAYFAYGTAIRQAQLSQMNLSRVVQDAPFGFIAISNNINPLIETLTNFRTQAKTAGMGFGSMLGQLFKGPGVIGLVTAAATALILVMPKIIDLFSGKGGASDATAKWREELFELEKELGLITGDQYLGMLESKLAAIKEKAKDDAALSWWQQIAISIKPDLLAKFVQSEEDLAKVKKEELEVEKEKKDIKKEELDLLQEEFEKQMEIRQAVKDSKGEMTVYDQVIPEFAQPGKTKKPGPPVIFSEAEEKAEMRIAEKWQADSKKFTDQLNRGLANATSTLAQGFVHAFGLGNSLLDQMIAAILGALAQAAISAFLAPLTGGISSFFGGIFGMGGEAAGAARSPGENMSLATARSSSEAISNAEFRLRGNDLFLVNKRAARRYERNNL